ncbi:uncharacterized protein METZ01_LOCUS401399 [marine metagenome]|uniref:Uncharacterized protein n=1 Tax=marine metagenome TaxID=408172 RepID=A0A382VRB0_9ZZZZ
MSKLNIKEEMRAIDTKDRGWYDSLTSDEKTKLGIWLLMRYTSSAGDRQFIKHYLEWTNEVVNVHFNKLRKHPQLQFQLMQLVGLGKTTFHPWIAPGKAMKQSKVQKWVIENYSHLNDDEVEIFISTKTKYDFIELFEEHGMNKKQIKELLKK